MYTQLIENGWKESEIWLMAFDDVPYSKSNPFTGHIYHTTKHDKDVYPGTAKINVRDDDLVAQSFFNAITSVPTTSDDYLYIYYDDHGGPGVLGVPDTCGKNIKAEDLNNALVQIENKYKKCLFGIEACFSGSVAQVITAKNMAIITAANAAESSYAAVYDSVIGNYLSNEFTNYWLAEMVQAPTETIDDLYHRLQYLTTGSHVCYYGDKDVKKLTLDVFCGKPQTVRPREDVKVLDCVPQRMATMHALEHMKQHGTAEERLQARKQLIKMGARSEKLEMALDKLLKQFGVAADAEIVKANCDPLPEGYFRAYDAFVAKVGQINGDDLGRLMVIKNLCARFSANDVVAAINKVL